MSTATLADAPERLRDASTTIRLGLQSEATFSDLADAGDTVRAYFAASADVVAQAETGLSRIGERMLQYRTPQQYADVGGPLTARAAAGETLKERYLVEVGSLLGSVRQVPPAMRASDDVLREVRAHLYRRVEMGTLTKAQAQQAAVEAARREGWAAPVVQALALDPLPEGERILDADARARLDAVLVDRVPNLRERVEGYQRAAARVAWLSGKLRAAGRALTSGVEDERRGDVGAGWRNA